MLPEYWLIANRNHGSLGPEYPTDELMAAITNGINRYMLRLAEQQIQLAFDQA